MSYTNIVQGNRYDIGDVVVLYVTFALDNVPTAPDTVQCSVRIPGVTTPQIVPHTGANGSYTAEFAPTIMGTYWYRWVGTGAAKGAAEMWFAVNEQRV